MTRGAFFHQDNQPVGRQTPAKLDAVHHQLHLIHLGGSQAVGVGDVEHAAHGGRVHAPWWSERGRTTRSLVRISSNLACVLSLGSLTCTPPRRPVPRLEGQMPLASGQSRAIPAQLAQLKVTLGGSAQVVAILSAPSYVRATGHLSPRPRANWGQREQLRDSPVSAKLASPPTHATRSCSRMPKKALAASDGVHSDLCFTSERGHAHSAPGDTPSLRGETRPRVEIV
ncbi:hypothetical protein CRUP_009686 [Coryphaenoides rupestris]|nr:hypothetical protein CRUP_009686 [Coryphaenoides rupestris]